MRLDVEDPRLENDNFSADAVFIQTADPFRYAQMLDITSQTVTEYCLRNNFSYESYIGVKRGFHNWQATYNRIYQLHELMQRGFPGWAIYLDADAYVVDLDFDLRAYLKDKHHYGAILTPSMATDYHWDVNAGVVLINLGHPIGRRIVQGWRDAFDRLSNGRLRDAVEWLDADSDQDFIQILLRTDPEIANNIYLQSTDLINSSYARFIRQNLRGESLDFDARMALIRNSVDEVMSKQANRRHHKRHASPEELVDCLYQAIFHRPADETGRLNAIATIEDQGPIRGLVTIVREFIASEEFHNRYTDGQNT